jgi:hypothetical protein
MAASIETGEEFRSGTPVELFRFPPRPGGISERRWSMTRDAQRFLINTPLGQANRAEFAVALQWVKELARR